METWKSILWTGGRYEVSSLGRVRSWLVSGGSKQRRVRPKVLRQSPNNAGRLMVHLSIDGRVSTRQVSRLVLEAFEGPCPEGMECCHRNDVFTDNRMKNLRWGTRRSNCDDALRNNKRVKGSQNGMSKLNEAQVMDLFVDRKRNGTPYLLLQKRYGVSITLISNICTGKAWRWLTSTARL